MFHLLISSLTTPSCLWRAALLHGTPISDSAVECHGDIPVKAYGTGGGRLDKVSKTVEDGYFSFILF